MTEIVDTDPFVQEIYKYLDALRSSGVVNMFGAGVYLEKYYGFDRTTANRFLTAWMEQFGEDN